MSWIRQRAIRWLTMTNFSNRSLAFYLTLLVMAGLSSSAIAGSAHSALKVDATLVWGSKDVAKDKKLAPATKELQTKLRKNLKWEHYYRINKSSLQLADLKPHRTRMSKECILEVKRLSETEVNVKLIGEGKIVVNRRHSLAKDNSVVLGGPGKHKDAWFVVLQFN